MDGRGFKNQSSCLESLVFPRIGLLKNTYIYVSVAKKIFLQKVTGNKALERFHDWE